MANILYGLCSVGIGHAVRGREIISELEKKHNVFGITSYRAYEYLSKYLPQLYNIEGFELFFKNNKVVLPKTGWKNLLKFNPANLSKISELAKKMEEFKPDLVISDWETTSSFLAKFMGIPLVSLDNQAFLRHGKFNVPIKYLFQYFFARFVLKILVRKPDYSLVMKFQNQEMAETENIFSALPLIREEVMKSKIKKGNHVLVYDSTQNNDKLIKKLKQIRANFIIYGYERVGVEGNLTFKNFNGENEFTKDLASCRAVITNAGFTLLSEAMYLGKPILCVPIKRHFEQTLNALYVRENKFGEFYKKINPKNIKKFLRRCEKYRKPKNNYKNDLHEKLEKIIERIKKNDVV